MTDEEVSQILAEADEIEFFGTGYPVGSDGRVMMFYCAEWIRRRFKLSDAQKLDLVLRVLERAGKSVKSDLISRLDLPRDDARRIIDLGLQTGTIEVTQETVSDSGMGRPRTLLQIPRRLSADEISEVED